MQNKKQVPANDIWARNGVNQGQTAEGRRNMVASETELLFPGMEQDYRRLFVELFQFLSTVFRRVCKIAKSDY